MAIAFLIRSDRKGCLLLRLGQAYISPSEGSGGGSGETYPNSTAMTGSFGPSAHHLRLMASVSAMLMAPLGSPLLCGSAQGLGSDLHLQSSLRNARHQEAWASALQLFLPSG